MALKAIAANVPVKGVDFLEYYYTLKGLPNPSHQVTLKVNRHIHVGNFNSNSVANALAMAEDAAKGCLIKSGCFRPNDCLARIPFRKYGFPVPPPSGDVIPNVVNWDNVLYNQSPTSYYITAEQITGIDVPITLEVHFSNSNQMALQYKVAATNTGGDAQEFTQPTGFIALNHQGQITVTNNQWVFFTVFPGPNFNGNVSQHTITIHNASDNMTILDHFEAIVQ